MFQKVNKQFYPKYNYFLLVSTVIIVNILFNMIITCSFMPVSFFLYQSMIVYCQLSIIHYRIFTCKHVLT